MTLHNLDDHISWLLSNGSIPPVGRSGNPAQSLTDSIDAVEGIDVEFRDVLLTEPEESSEQPRSARPSTPPVNVVNVFKRPEVPTGAPRESRATSVIGSVTVGGDMGKLSS